jgi:hypothetical protein
MLRCRDLSAMCHSRHIAALQQNVGMGQQAIWPPSPPLRCKLWRCPLKSNGRPRHNIGERETGDALVVVRQGAQFALSNVHIEIVERLVADQLLDFCIDEIRWVLAIDTHHLGGDGAACRLIRLKRLARVAMAA